MRRYCIFTLIAAVFCILLLSGCKSEENVKTMIVDDGMEITLPSELKEETMGGHDYFYSDGTVMVVIDRTADEELAEYGVTSSADVVELLEKLTLNEKEFVSNKAGNPYMTCTKELVGKDYYLYITGRRANGSLWTVEFMCPSDKQNDYAEKFDEWNNSIVIK